MEKKKVYHITEHQASILINEEMQNPDLMKMVGDKHSAHPYPISTGKFDVEGENSSVGVGVGANKGNEKPEVDLKAIPKPTEIKEAWKLLRQASSLLVQGAPKLQEENLSKNIQKLAKDINDLIMKANAELNVNETDLTS